MKLNRNDGAACFRRESGLVDVVADSSDDAAVVLCEVFRNLLARRTGPEVASSMGIYGGSVAIGGDSSGDSRGGSILIVGMGAVCWGGDTACAGSRDIVVGSVCMGDPGSSNCGSLARGAGSITSLETTTSVAGGSDERVELEAAAAAAAAAMAAVRLGGSLVR